MEQIYERFHDADPPHLSWSAEITGDGREWHVEKVTVTEQDAEPVRVVELEPKEHFSFASWHRARESVRKAVRHPGPEHALIVRKRHLLI
jgi:hypothetical protein